MDEDSSWSWILFISINRTHKYWSLSSAWFLPVNFSFSDGDAPTDESTRNLSLEKKAPLCPVHITESRKSGQGKEIGPSRGSGRAIEDPFLPQQIAAIQKGLTEEDELIT